MAHELITIGIKVVNSMRRREYLAASGGTLLATAGCVQLQHVRSALGVDRLDPQAGTDETVTLQGTGGDGTWPQVAHDARNSRYAPGATPPQEDATVAWKAFIGRWTYEPIVNDDVYVAERGTDSTVLSFDSNDGSERWESQTVPNLRRPPAMDDDVFVVTRTDDSGYSLRRLTAKNGEEQWTREEDVTASGRGNVAGPTVDDRNIYIPSNTGVNVFDKAGNHVWSTTLDERIRDGRVTNWVKPAVTDTHVYTFDRRFDDGDGDLPIYALEKKTGERVWTTEIEFPRSWHPQRSWRVHSPYVVAGRDHVFVATRESQQTLGHADPPTTPARLYALDAESGEIAWLWELEGSLAPPAYAEGYLFVAAWDYDAERATLHALDVKEEVIAWTYETDVGEIGAPAITPETVYFRQGYELAALAVADGSPSWRLALDDQSYNVMKVGDPVVTTETVYQKFDYVTSEGDETSVWAVRD